MLVIENPPKSAISLHPTADAGGGGPGGGGGEDGEGAQDQDAGAQHQASGAAWAHGSGQGGLSADLFLYSAESDSALHNTVHLQYSGLTLRSRRRSV